MGPRERCQEQVLFLQHSELLANGHGRDAVCGAFALRKENYRIGLRGTGQTEKRTMTATAKITKRSTMQEVLRARRRLAETA